mgnify:CR=1 FL=1
METKIDYLQALQEIEKNKNIVINLFQQLQRKCSEYEKVLDFYADSSNLDYVEFEGKLKVVDTYHDMAWEVLEKWRTK